MVFRHLTILTLLLICGCGREMRETAGSNSTAAPGGSVGGDAAAAQGEQDLAALVAKLGGRVETQIELSRTPVTDEDLARMVFPDAVRSIALHHTNITDKGVLELKRARNLERVQLGLTKITDASIPHLKEMPRLVQAEIYAEGVSNESRNEMLRFLSAREQEFALQNQPPPAAPPQP